MVEETEYPVLEVALLRQLGTTERLDFSWDSLDFSWECVEFTEDYIALQLYFVSPSYVSTGLNPDKLSLVFYDNSFFQGASQWPLWPMAIEERTMPGQMSSETGAALEAASALVQAAAAAAFGGAFLLQLCLLGGLGNLLALIQDLQLLVHRMLANTKTPANASLFFSKLLQIVSADILRAPLDLDENIPLYFDLPDSLPLTINFDALGYGTPFFAVNMGSVLVLYCLMPVYALGLYATYWVAGLGWFPRLHSQMSRALNAFFFEAIIGLVEYFYIIVVVCILLNVNEYLINGVTYDLNFLALVLNSIAVIGYLLLCLALFCFKVETLQSPGFQLRVGAVYRDLRLKGLGKIALIEPLGASVRRLGLGAVLVFLVDYPVLQLAYFCFVSLLTIAVLGELWPFIERWRNVWALATEVAMFLMLYLLCGTWNDHLVVSVEDREIIGWCMIGVASVCLLAAAARAA